MCVCVLYFYACIYIYMGRNWKLIKKNKIPCNCYKFGTFGYEHIYIYIYPICASYTCEKIQTKCKLICKKLCYHMLQSSVIVRFQLVKHCLQFHTCI